MKKIEDSCPLMVSIRCIAYNQEAYIRQTLDGFVMQKTTFRFEAIVHDDASTDGTADIIKEYAAKYPSIIKPILEKENQYSKGGNVLFKIMESHMHGKYVCICEGDDYWTTPNKLQKQVDYLESHPECVLVHTGVAFVDKNSHVLGEKRFDDTNIDYKRYIIEKGNPIVSASVCYRRDADLEWVSVRESMPFNLLMGDKPHWIFLATKGDIRYLQEITSAYRILDTSASHHNNPEKALAYSQNGSDINLYFNKLLNIGVPESKIKIYALTHRMLVLRKCDRKYFWGETNKSLRSMPSIITSIQFWKVIIKRLLNR